MSKRKDLKLNAHEIAEEQAASQVKSTVEIVCDILLREFVDKNHSECDVLRFLKKDEMQSEL